MKKNHNDFFTKNVFEKVFCDWQLYLFKRPFSLNWTIVAMAKDNSQRPVILCWSDAVIISLSANGSTAFKWKLCCHWLKGLQQHQTGRSNTSVDFHIFRCWWYWITFAMQQYISTNTPSVAKAGNYTMLGLHLAVPLKNQHAQTIE